MGFRPTETDPFIRRTPEKPSYTSEREQKRHGWATETDRSRSAETPPFMTPPSERMTTRGHGLFETPEDKPIETGPWIAPERGATHLRPINLAPLKGVLESDPVRSKVLRVLIEDGGWVTTTDLLKAARQVRSIVGAVTIGTILSGMNDLVSARLILSRSSLGSGLDWAEWRINPDWLEPTRKLLQMLTRAKIRESRFGDQSTQ